MSEGGAAREGETESKAGSRLWAVSTEPDVGLELTECEIMTWAEVGRVTDWATQAPQVGIYLNRYYTKHFFLRLLLIFSVSFEAILLKTFYSILLKT